jgi:hypothetical protein
MVLPIFLFLIYLPFAPFPKEAGSNSSLSEGSGRWLTGSRKTMHKQMAEYLFVIIQD